MIKNLTTLLFVLLMGLGWAISSPLLADELRAARSVASGRNDVVYLAPATEVYEVMPLGNGRLGVMLRNHNGHGFWNKIGDSPGFDGSGVFAVTVQEMQLQSHDRTIRVYPAWPKGWEGQFTLAAKGGFMVSSQIGKDANITHLWSSS